MVMNFNAAKQYKQNSALTATPAELTMMLYQGLVRFLNIALQQMDKGNIQEVHTHLLKSQDIVRELLCTLNQDVPLAKQMTALYEYMLERMIEANLQKNPQIIKEVLELAVDFRDTWGQAMKLAK